MHDAVYSPSTSILALPYIQSPRCEVSNSDFCMLHHLVGSLTCKICDHTMLKLHYMCRNYSDITLIL